MRRHFHTILDVAHHNTELHMSVMQELWVCLRRLKCNKKDARMTVRGVGESRGINVSYKSANATMDGIIQEILHHGDAWTKELGDSPLSEQVDLFCLRIGQLSPNVERDAHARFTTARSPRKSLVVWI